jgi:DegV family protein with EDD domain
MIRIVTDSTCDGPAALFGHPALQVVPLYVLFGQQAQRDGVDITTAQFWERLPHARPLPTTSQATPGDFLEPFRRYTDAGDEVIAVVISGKLSGTFESATLAMDALPGRQIEVIDSRSVSIGLGLMAAKALAMVDAGATHAQIVSQIRAMRDKVHLLFAVETLEYLQRGGRIGRAQAFAGTLLQFKPLLGVRDGEVYPVMRVRTKRRALETLMDQLWCAVPCRGSSVKLAVVHSCAETEADEVAHNLSERFASPHIFRTTLGPVIGVHVGPGTVGAAAYVDETDVN